MNDAQALDFAHAWVAAWNAHDIDAVLSHFHDDAEFASPLALRTIPASEGVVRGKDAIRAYWRAALDRNPSLRFTLEEVYVGIGTLVITFRDHTGAPRCEVLTFADGLVTSGFGTFVASGGERLP